LLKWLDRASQGYDVDGVELLRAAVHLDLSPATRRALSLVEQAVGNEHDFMERSPTGEQDDETARTLRMRVIQACGQVRASIPAYAMRMAARNSIIPCFGNKAEEAALSMYSYVVNTLSPLVNEFAQLRGLDPAPIMEALRTKLGSSNRERYEQLRDDAMEIYDLFAAMAAGVVPIPQAPLRVVSEAA
jgi:hypothetical protein